MADGGVRDMLRGRRVALVHEDAFQRRYLADVIEGSGATIAGSVASGAAAEGLFGAAELPVALVLSDAADGAQAIARLARMRQAVILLVQPARAAPPRLIAADRILRSPVSGFQVVDALAELLRIRRAAERSGGPRVCGH